MNTSSLALWRTCERLLFSEAHRLSDALYQRAILALDQNKWKAASTLTAASEEARRMMSDRAYVQGTNGIAIFSEADFKREHFYAYYHLPAELHGQLEFGVTPLGIPLAREVHTRTWTLTFLRPEYLTLPRTQCMYLNAWVSMVSDEVKLPRVVW